jgi:phosphoketolase
MRGPWALVGRVIDGHPEPDEALAPRAGARFFAFHGYMEEGTTTTPFARVVLKWE